MANLEDLQLVYHSRNRKDCRDRSLVLSAAGINHHLRRNAGEHALLVLPKDAGRAQAELDAYDEENPPTAMRTPPAFRNANGWYGVAGYAAALVLVEFLNRTHRFGIDWVDSGRTDAGLIRDGQLWRTVTSLTLHADIPHLAGNLAIGGLFGLFVGQHLGSGLGWACILAAGAVGNLLNATLHHPGHTSIGASTAVFAALGILAGSMWHHRGHDPVRSLARWTPLIGGAALLGHLGTGGVRTDVGAHVAGFIAGAALGLLLGRSGNDMAKTRRSQLLFAVSAAALLTASWLFALN